MTSGPDARSSWWPASSQNCFASSTAFHHAYSGRRPS